MHLFYHHNTAFHPSTWPFRATRDDVLLIPATSELLQRGRDLFAARPDKGWSLTDCVSFVVMEEQKLIQALTTDHHFTQAGFHALLASA